MTFSCPDVDLDGDGIADFGDEQMDRFQNRDGTTDKYGNVIHGYSGFAARDKVKSSPGSPALDGSYESDTESDGGRSASSIASAATSASTPYGTPKMHPRTIGGPFNQSEKKQMQALFAGIGSKAPKDIRVHEQAPRHNAYTHRKGSYGMCAVLCM
jgi:hypothetical protein